MLYRIDKVNCVGRFFFSPSDLTHSKSLHVIQFMVLVIFYTSFFLSFLKHKYGDWWIKKMRRKKFCGFFLDLRGYPPSLTKIKKISKYMNHKTIFQICKSNTTLITICFDPTCIYFHIPAHDQIQDKIWTRLLSILICIYLMLFD